MAEAYQPIIAAGIFCTFLFIASHLWWQWRELHKKKSALLPVFWERPLVSIVGVFLVSSLTRWNVQYFIFGLVFFYLFFLKIHTYYLDRLIRKKDAH